MPFSDTVSPPKRRAHAFITINGVDYFIGGWLHGDADVRTERPLVITTVFSDNGQRFVVIRDDTFKRTIYTIEEFIQKIENGIWSHLPQPKYQAGQLFKNLYTERQIRIIDVPYAPNDRDGEYTYFIRDISPTFGRNFASITERELDDLFKREGVEEY